MEISLSIKEISKMKHAVGFEYYSKVKNRVYKAYRNYYCAGGEDVAIWKNLASKGLAKNVEKNTFVLTDLGKEILGKYLGCEIKDKYDD